VLVNQKQKKSDLPQQLFKYTEDECKVGAINYQYR
jgi:hypothetical protein